MYFIARLVANDNKEFNEHIYTLIQGTISSVMNQNYNIIMYLTNN